MNKIAKRTNAKELRRAMCNEIVYWRASEREREREIVECGVVLFFVCWVGIYRHEKILMRRREKIFMQLS